MTKIIYLSKLLAFTAIFSVAILNSNQLRVKAQETPTTPTNTTNTTTANPKICSLDPVESLLPPVSPQKTSSVFSYLAEQGFSRSEDGSWVCYVNDPNKDNRYYTLFKVTEKDGKLIGSSFLDDGNLILGQDARSLDFFMTLIQHHTTINQGNQDSVRRYLEAFISLVKDGKIKPSRRGFLFDEPNRALIIYHPLSAGELKGTAITINIQLPKKVSSQATRN
ncbi:hypothetical protein CLI64_26715 [Nostoc sp. CENA543]|uniref:hypothetical protein n=1 Tax=Nostoc sp. CENA543 TaxID=1869241 RepID=UPI000CA252F7|nr:hypothetical protein [Nostoc sp. CENA543]AUT03694.1 hypothetical protein CLI64_26715 [Nostoc sp. CENA543]